MFGSIKKIYNAVSILSFSTVIYFIKDNKCVYHGKFFISLETDTDELSIPKVL